MKHFPYPKLSKSFCCKILRSIFSFTIDFSDTNFFYKNIKFTSTKLLISLYIYIYICNIELNSIYLHCLLSKIFVFVLAISIIMNLLSITEVSFLLDVFL